MSCWDEVTIGQCRLIRGDALEVVPTLDPVDAVITDPPYGVALTAKRAKQRGGGVTIRPGIYSHDDTLTYLQQVVLPCLELCRKLAPCVALTPGIRHMWLYPQPDDVGCFYSAAGTGMGRWGFTCMHPILYYGKDPYLAQNLGSRANSCGQIYPNDANEQAHPCAKPLPMMEWLVRRASLPSMTVLDPFAGSFTTGVAALKLGRAFLGIEIDRQYFEAGCRRIEDASKQLTLFPPAAPTTPPRQEVLL